MYDGMDLRRLDECWLPSDRALNLWKQTPEQSIPVYSVQREAATYGSFGSRAPPRL